MIIRGFLSLIVCCLLWGTTCSQVVYDITGVWVDGAGKTLQLRTLEGGNVEGEFLDSVVVATDGTFILRGKVDRKQCAMIASAKYGFRAIFLDGTPMRFTINTGEYSYKNPSAPYVLDNETKDQLAAQAMVQFWGDDYIRNFSLGGLGLSLKRATTKGKQDSIAAEIKQVEREQWDQMNAFLQQYNDSDVAPYFIEMNMLRMMALEQISSFYDRFTDRVKQTEKGREIGERIALLKKLAPGSFAPEFELTTSDGKKIALKDLRGHIVLLDFWASWCGPCMDEMPNVKALYEKYHDRGLEIVGISMDNNKAKWEGAIERAGLVWHHVSSLKGMNRCPVAKLYQVVAIPKLYIVDKDGKIIAKDLRGEDLREKMDELFQ
ncbi:AhpC/TSA family protein [Butyricimonas virosa]|jgi:peroxiredoxin|uniref:AhpC/TSA family protein n=1 Tax=Butyricimonas virosa TaxID=544645 RepID=A0A413IPI7_9BACT|nr:TlpA disulfide reductase family protein [Butyricimonas virosa]MCI7389518.1 AhpC/TSA family protein [Butyricimonas virosa]MDY4906141.1 TlpA disulfide reductase family protein [Butyricimonas virosa]QRO51201.1 redoxin domain-containing protein [Butyricimonas virosa]RGY18926.1 AhpC/TSA family protein [Butyricimonas virosa]RHI20694.1 AhpC/TSA family protein [Butyricimonas virosa]